MFSFLYKLDLSTKSDILLPSSLTVETAATSTPELDGKRISSEEFNKYIWYYIPKLEHKINYSFQWIGAEAVGYGSLTVELLSDINSKNIKAIYNEVSTDTTVIQETRNCNCTLNAY